MHVLVIGAAGMVGRKLLDKIAAEPGSLGGDIDKLTLVDVIEPAAPDRFASISVTKAADLSDPGVAESLIASRPDMIFHLAAIVSGEAEADFEKGYKVNLDGTRALFEAIRLESERRPTGRAWYLPHQSPCSARRFRTRSATSSSQRR